jgi:putative restriction endonuclease
MALDSYLKMFASLKRAPNAIFTDLTKRKAPHKPLLLLSVIDLIREGIISSPVIDVTGDLVELNDLFTSYWRKVAPHGHFSSIAFPFSRLNSEPFWELLSTDGEVVDVSRMNINNVTQLRQHACSSRIDAELFALLSKDETRVALRQVLLESNFSPEGQQLLGDQIALNDQAYIYGMAIYQKAHQPMVQEVIDADQYKPLARDQGFRRVIVKTYDHRCALCGLRIVTPEGHTAVDAAHIVPWSKSQNDDIRNGMALCKLCHWAFDEGMLGVSKDYKVIASRQIGVDQNVPGILQTLPGRNILCPSDRALWPALENLAAHRRESRLNR